MTKLHHYDNEGTARLVTFGCYRNLPFLSDDIALQGAPPLTVGKDCEYTSCCNLS